MAPSEILEKLTVLARNEGDKTEHKDQLRAIELLGKHYGMFERRGEADRGTLIREINSLFRTLEQAARRKVLGTGDVVEVIPESVSDLQRGEAGLTPAPLRVRQSRDS